MLDSELAASADMNETLGGGEDELFPDDGEWTGDVIDDLAGAPILAPEPDVLHPSGPRYLDLARHEGGTPGAGMGFELSDAPVMTALVDATDTDIARLEEEDLLGVGDGLRSDKLGIAG